MKLKKLTMSVLLAATLIAGMASCNSVPNTNEPDATVESVSDSSSNVDGNLENGVADEGQSGVEDKPRQSEDHQDEALQTDPLPILEEVDLKSADMTNTAVDNDAASGSAEDGDDMTRVHIGVGDQTFTAQFYDNETAQAFLAMMPMTLDMSDLNRNEKMVYLPESLLTADTERPGTIHAGEIMLYYDDCVVLFYQTFPNSYGGYTRLGVIEDATGLAAAVGSGNISVTFSVA